MIVFSFLPEIAFALRPGRGWQPLLSMPGWERQLWMQMVLLLGVPGVSAVVEFYERGQGTPIPYDPPQRLVTSGIYRYVANPMQISCTAIMLAWACLLQNGWLVLAALVSAIYSAGLAEWDEGEDLKECFGDDWQRYRAVVKSWIPNWKPYHPSPPAVVYLARSCQPCQEVRRWIEKRSPMGLELVDAEQFTFGPIRRMSYDPGDGSGIVDGVRAMGRVLEHFDLRWALLGCLLRMPGIWQIVQLLLDASGLGPREIEPQMSCRLKG
jgi:protein-S-isoprenylcysteine O-methyltransferase Ste14